VPAAEHKKQVTQGDGGGGTCEIEESVRARGGTRKEIFSRIENSTSYAARNSSKAAGGEGEFPRTTRSLLRPPTLNIEDVAM